MQPLQLVDTTIVDSSRAKQVSISKRDLENLHSVGFTEKIVEGVNVGSQSISKPLHKADVREKNLVIHINQESKSRKLGDFENGSNMTLITAGEEGLVAEL